MNRIEFMNSLGEMLRELSIEERGAAIQFYNDYFEDAGVENEAYVVTELGSPEKVAATIKAGLKGENELNSEYSETGYKDTRLDEKDALANRATENNEKKVEIPKKNIGLIILLVMAIVLVGIPLMLPIIGVILAIIITIPIVFASLIVAAIAVMIGGVITFIVGLSQIITALPSALLLAGVGMLLFAIGMVLTVLLIKLTVITLVAMFRGLVWICRKPFEKRRVVA